MSKLPDYIRIMGLDYSIEEDSTLSSFDHAGINKLHTQEILISTGLSEEMKLAIVFHEMVEALNFSMELELKHKQITAISSRIYQILSDNPDLCAYLLELMDEIEIKEEGEVKDHLVNQSFRDGKQVWKIARLLKLAEELEPFDLPMKCLNIHNLYPDISTTLDFVKHVKWILEADMSYPIILDEEGYVMDGRHRILKALLEEHESIKAVRFKKTPTCCYIYEEEEEK